MTHTKFQHAGPSTDLWSALRSAEKIARQHKKGACKFAILAKSAGVHQPPPMKSLSTARVIGFFSLPSPMMAEHNPSAYSAAMATAPAGAGACAHCGNGILHHVVIRDEDTTRFIGSDCALKVGVSRESVRYRMTSDQIAARDAKRAAEIEEWQRKQQAEEDARAAHLVARREKVGDLVDMLRAVGGEFYNSLADQLEVRPLSFRQGEYVAKATSATGRRNKKNAAAFDAVWNRCCED